MLSSSNFNPDFPSGYQERISCILEENEKCFTSRIHYLRFVKKYEDNRNYKNRHTTEEMNAIERTIKKILATTLDFGIDYNKEKLLPLPLPKKFCPLIANAKIKKSKHNNNVAVAASIEKCPDISKTNSNITTKADTSSNSPITTDILGKYKSDTKIEEIQTKLSMKQAEKEAEKQEEKVAYDLQTDVLLARKLEKQLSKQPCINSRSEGEITNRELNHSIRDGAANHRKNKANPSTISTTNNNSVGSNLNSKSINPSNSAWFTARANQAPIPTPPQILIQKQHEPIAEVIHIPASVISSSVLVDTAIAADIDPKLEVLAITKDDISPPPDYACPIINNITLPVEYKVNKPVPVYSQEMSFEDFIRACFLNDSKQSDQFIQLFINENQMELNDLIWLACHSNSDFKELVPLVGPRTKIKIGIAKWGQLSQ